MAPLPVPHDNRDPRVPMGQGDPLVVPTQKRQMKVTCERYDHGGHGFVFAEHGRRASTAIAERLRQHLKETA